MSATQTQLIASHPQNSAKVSANAGTGKTHVLTSRVLRLMLENVHPSKILCLTYTKAAAAEMVERISKTLRKWAIGTDAELADSIFSLSGEPPTQKQISRARELFTLTLESTPPPRIRNRIRVAACLFGALHTGGPALPHGKGEFMPPRLSQGAHRQYPLSDSRLLRRILP